MIKWLKEHKKLIVFSLYACITFALLFFHENWRDEAQAWLLARDCSIPELINAMKYEGHFLIWYFILMPFAKLGFPYETTNIISWLITCISVWLVLDQAPFRFDKRVLFISTFPLLYLFPVISRCYCLIPLATVLMSIFYKDRYAKPLRYLLSIVFLLNTHVIMAGMVGVVLFDFLIDLFKARKYFSKSLMWKYFRCFLITFVLALASIFPLFGSLSTNKSLNIVHITIFKFLEALFLYPYTLLRENVFLGTENFIIRVFVSIIIIIVILFEIQYRPFKCLKIWLCLIWQCMIYSFIFGESLQKASTIIFIILFFQWSEAHIGNDNIGRHFSSLKKIQSLFVVVYLTMNILTGWLYITHYALSSKFSNASDAANYINNHLPDNSIILNGSRVEYTSSIIPYVNKNIKFFSIAGSRYFSYAIMDETNNLEINLGDFKNLLSTFNEKQELYYVYCPGKVKLTGNSEEKRIIEQLRSQGILKVLYVSNDKSINAEDYILYGINLDNLR